MGEFRGVGCVFLSTVWKGLLTLINHAAFSEWLVKPPSFSQTQSQRGPVVFGKQPNSPPPTLKLGADLKNIFLV